MMGHKRGADAWARRAQSSEIDAQSSLAHLCPPYSVFLSERGEQLAEAMDRAAKDVGAHYE